MRSPAGQGVGDEAGQAAVGGDPDLACGRDVDVPDLVAGRVSADLPDCSYRPGLAPADLRAVLPPAIHDPLVAALRWIDRHRLRGYIREEGVALGVESRSSAPLRVLRDPEGLESPSHPGLFPCGEGAGYAGGIVSAALDGLRVAAAIARG